MAKKKRDAEAEARSAAAKLMGARGGTARAKKMTPAQRKAAAQRAARARWKEKPE